MLALDEQNHNLKNPIEDEKKNYVWRGFEVKAKENAKISWLTIGNGSKSYKGYTQTSLDEVFKILFGVGLDEAQKQGTNIMESWYSQLEKFAGRSFANQARENWKIYVKDSIIKKENAAQKVKKVSERKKNKQGTCDFH